MARVQSLDAKLARLRELRREPLSPQALQALRGSLRDASNIVVAEAAEIAGEARLAALLPDLVAAFERFLDQPEKRDKQCRAKIAVVEALNKLEYTDETFFLGGVRYVQQEPVWGGSQDSAVPVRVSCAFALVRIRHRGALSVLVDMLADKEKAARIGAVQALAYSGTEAAGLLLRLKARVGDREPEVISECFAGILELAPEQGVAFVTEFLDSEDDAIQEGALLALGTSRRAEAFEILKMFARRASGDLLEVAHVALALLRLPEAMDYLLTLVADRSRAVATAALGALAVHRYDARVCERTAAAVAATGDTTLRSVFESRFRANA
jgi:HEAT repeat protein